ncbi:hypothetical protein F511_04815 [Dorcoceras hygrometricum]|uniref:Uncharacterized protein n=1 Tax=Dorcoceras hygrometricum TaxID=472368 RepID=A0A2Z7AV63_9LAMI|nr:hypothetical protein F511_04815 [Dorcoceras hygrometricum]
MRASMLHSAQGKMNAAAASGTVEFTGGNVGGGSDSDSNPDDSPEYYQPISSVDEGELSHEDQNSDDEINGHQDLDLANGYVDVSFLENGISSVDLSEEEYDDEHEEVTESERAIERAFIEDERRRHAPLTAENAGRVMEAMREVSLGGPPPDWVGLVPEDQWLERLRRLSRQPSASA